MSNPMTDDGCVSDLQIDEALSGELPAAGRASLHAHMDGCARCRARHDTIVQQRAEWLAALPSFATLASRAALASPARRRGPFAGALLAACAAAAALSLLVRSPDTPGDLGAGLEPPARIDIEDGHRKAGAGASTRPAARTKGAPSLGFFIKRDGRVIAGHSGAVVHPGEQLRFIYTSDRPRYLAVFNRDATRASVYFPNGDTGAPIARGQGVALDFGVELDDYIGMERVFAVFCDAPMVLEPLRRALATDAELSAPAGCSVDVLSLNKQVPP